MEHCQGTMMQFERLSSSVRDEEGLATFLEEYENYKDPHDINQDYPDAMKGISTNSINCIYDSAADLKFSSKLKFFQISVLSSTFDKIKKEHRILFNLSH